MLDDLDGGARVNGRSSRRSIEQLELLIAELWLACGVGFLVMPSDGLKAIPGELEMVGVRADAGRVALGDTLFEILGLSDNRLTTALSSPKGSELEKTSDLLPASEVDFDSEAKGSKLSNALSKSPSTLGDWKSLRESDREIELLQPRLAKDPCPCSPYLAELKEFAEKDARLLLPSLDLTGSLGSSINGTPSIENM